MIRINVRIGLGGKVYAIREKDIPLVKKLLAVIEKRKWNLI